MTPKQKAAIAAMVSLVSVSLLYGALPAGYAGTVFDSLRGTPMQIPINRFINEIVDREFRV